jgi:GNAT superfamily N-acetyltransferase
MGRTEMLETITIEEFGSDSNTDEQLAAANVVWNAVDEADWHPDDPRSPDGEMLSWYRSVASDRRWSMWLARDASGEPVGFSELWWGTTKENRHRGHAEVLVSPHARRRGIGTRLLRALVERAPREQLSLLTGNALPDSGSDDFAKVFGARVAITRGASSEFTQAENRLSVKDLDRALMESWVERASERASDYELVFWEGLTPEELLEPFTQVKHVMNTAPHTEGEEDWLPTPEQLREREVLQQKEGLITLTYAVRYVPSGELAGYTRIMPSAHRPQLAYQDDTAVDPAHRNKGLGRWLKAAMILKVLEEKPEIEIVETWNAATNAAMLHINEEMGFRRTKVWTKYEIETETLKAALADRA